MPELTFWVALTELNHETAVFASTGHLASVVLPVAEWVGLGRPGRISFTPVPATPEGDKE